MLSDQPSTPSSCPRSPLHPIIVLALKTLGNMTPFFKTEATFKDNILRSESLPLPIFLQKNLWEIEEILQNARKKRARTKNDCNPKESLSALKFSYDYINFLWSCLETLAIDEKDSLAFEIYQSDMGIKMSSILYMSLQTIQDLEARKLIIESEKILEADHIIRDYRIPEIAALKNWIDKQTHYSNLDRLVMWDHESKKPVENSELKNAILGVWSKVLERIFNDRKILEKQKQDEVIVLQRVIPTLIIEKKISEAFSLLKAWIKKYRSHPSLRNSRSSHPNREKILLNSSAQSQIQTLWDTLWPYAEDVWSFYISWVQSYENLLDQNCIPVSPVA